MMFILDTDHISLLQREHLPLAARLKALPPNQLATTVISYEEQISGRLAVVRRSRSGKDKAVSYFWLQKTLDFFCRLPVLPFDDRSAEIYEGLKDKKIRIGTQDLLIGAITLANNGTLLTRNRIDFQMIPNIQIEDWSY